VHACTESGLRFGDLAIQQHSATFSNCQQLLANVSNCQQHRQSASPSPARARLVCLSNSQFAKLPVKLLVGESYTTKISQLEMSQPQFAKLPVKLRVAEAKC
jgi:hypothetical protein